MSGSDQHSVGTGREEVRHEAREREKETGAGVNSTLKAMTW